MTVQTMLEKAIDLFGLNDKRTIELSQMRDEEIVKSQRKIYEEWQNEQFFMVSGYTR